MRTRFPHLLAVCLVVGFGVAGCTKQSSAFPLSLQTLRQLSPATTREIFFEERAGDIAVSITDRHGDRHIHMLDFEGVSRQHALELLTQKQAELKTRP